jgi:hypothetical protein
VVAAAVLAAVLFAVLALRPGTGGVSDATAAPAAVEDGVLVPYLRFGGTATVQARPDRADLTVISRVEAATARAALRGAGARHRAVLARLKALGIPAADLQTASTSVEEERRKGRVLFVAVVATNVTVRDVDAVGRVVTEASEEGATISGPSFTLENRRAAYDDALAKAIGDARAKAEASLGQIGGRAVAVVSVDDQPGSPIAMSTAGGADMATEEAGRAVPVEPGRITVDAFVVVTFSYER